MGNCNSEEKWSKCGCQSRCNCESESEMHAQTGDEHTDKLIMIADKAWHELFKEKAKAHWEKTMGRQMDAMVEAVVKTSMDFHMNMMKGKQATQENVGKIHKVMSSMESK